MHIASCSFLVTGGSSGLGAACVRRLVERGARVVLVDLDPRGEQLAAELGEAARFVAADVTNSEAIRGAIQTVETLGTFRGAVHCAGIVYGERVLKGSVCHDLAAFRRVIEVNLIGTFNVLRLSSEAIARTQPDDQGERGVIITTASISAFEGQIGQVAYAASKGGVAAMTLPAARELARYGIRVVSVAPGVFDTPLMSRVNERYRQSLTEQTCFPPRFGDPAEFAALVEHILENRMLNGTVIRLDGAMRMQAK